MLPFPLRPRLAAAAQRCPLWSVALAFLAFAAAPLRAQLDYTTPGAPLVETFDAGLPAALNNSAPWTDNVTFPGWYVQFDVAAAGTPTTYRISNTSANNAINHFRNDGNATDGALGGRAADTAGHIYYAVRIRNTTGVTLRTFTLRYTLEQWSVSSAIIPNAFTAAFRFGTPADLKDGFWAPLQYAATETPRFDGAGLTLNGSLAANRATSQTLTVGGLAWEPDTDLWIRFQDTNDGGVDHAIALDDVTFTASTESDVPVGGVIFGRNNYIEIHPGDCPLIIAAPHGGLEEPADIADRTWGVFARDVNTQDMARRMAAEIFARTGKRPHVVLSLIHRRKLDPNREIVEAAQGDPNAEIAWHEYHGALDAARAEAERQFGFAFVVDSHGHGHTIQRIEFGYLVKNAELSLTDAQLEHPAYGEHTSCRSHAHLPGLHFPSFLRGPRSLGALFVQRGYPSVPSPDMPGPDGAPYFEGLYTNEAHGSRDNFGNSQAVIMETHWDGLRDTTAARIAFARAFAASIHDFLYDQWGYVLGSGSLFQLSASSTSLRENGPPLTLTVTRSAHLGETETIALAFSGTATPATDYTVSATSVTFAPGETQKTITLTPIDNDAADGAKTIVAALAPVASQTADVLPLTLLLSDDERPTVTLAAAQTELTERGPPLAVEVRRDDTSSPLTVELAFAGDAVPGTDYTLNGLSAGNQLTFAAGAATQTFQLTPRATSTADAARRIVISVLPSSGAGSGPPLALTLRDDGLPADLQLWLAHRIEDQVWRDDSAHARHAALKPASAAAPTPGRAPFGQALEFDGAKTAVVVPQFAPAAGEFTIAFRFRADPSGTTSGERHLLNLGASTSVARLNVFLAESSGALRTTLSDSSATPQLTTLNVANFAADASWRHYALTASTTSGVRVYLDGALVQSSPTWSGQFAPVGPLWLGWRGEYNPSPLRHHRGALADVRFYSRALADTEISALLAPPEPPLSAWQQWQRDHFTESELADAALSGATADADGDGLANALEFALGLNPRAADASPGFTVTANAQQRLTLTFERRALPDLTYAVEASSDLASWTTIWSSTGSENTAGPVTITDTQPLDTAPRRFLRLKVSSTGF